MSFIVSAKNKALDALDLSSVSLHTSFPGSTGANEVTGGTYARVASTFGAAAAGARTLSSAIAIDVPACTVAWLMAWDSAGTTPEVYSPNDGNPQEFQVDVSANTIRCPSHGYSDAQTVVFYADTVPSPLVEGTVYYVRDATTDTFKVAASSGGSAIDLSTQGGSGCTVSKITLEVYGSAGSHPVTTWSVGLPN